MLAELRSLLEAPNVNPLPSLFQLLETTTCLSLQLFSPSSKPGTLHLSGVVSVVRSFFPTLLLLLSFSFKDIGLLLWVNQHTLPILKSTD